jgi:hypothetical protein
MNSADLLAAGAVIPVDVALPDDSPADLVSARAYRSPVLGDRVVVRLTADSLAPGEDLAMEFLGMSAPEVTGPLGKQRRRALGFPGWALINDPDHAAFALEVVKEFKKHARRASSKPGFAKDGFDEIGVKLGRSVPHFLPSYWEEVGRAFLEVGSTTYASQSFNKAREAERVHALDVDESLRRETFLEFALAGALAVKALGAYAKDLAANYDATVAYGHFRELCLRRTLGGIPPWSQMGTELRRLMRGAKIKHGPEEQSLARDLLGASSLNKAPVGFWKHFTAAYAAIGETDAEVRGTLLNLFPGQNEKSAYYEQYLDLLDAAGALAGVTAEASTVAAAAAPAESAAAWLHRALDSMTGWWNSGYPHRLFEIARRMAGRLIADGNPVDCGVNGSVHLDMADLLLELGVPVADPSEHTSADLRRWARASKDGPDRQRDLDYVAADARFQPLLRAALDHAFGEDDFEAVAADKSGLFTARAEWLETRTQALRLHPLPEFEANLFKLTGVLRESIAEEFPEAMEKLSEVDATASIAATIRTGILDEFGWPVLEAEIERLRSEDGGKIFVSGAFPTLVLASTKRAVALNGAGRVAEHELRLPKDAEVRLLRYVAGQFLAVFGDSWNSKFYWSGKAGTIRDYEGYFYNREHPADAIGIEVPGGGVSEGRRALSPGDSKPGNFGQKVYSDGETLWWYGWSGSEHGCFEFDPKTGEQGRKSWPAFFEDYGREDFTLQTTASALYPVPDSAARSPLGPRGGFYGWRVRQGEDCTECEGMDGRSLSVASSTQFEGLMTWPGGNGLPVSTGDWPKAVLVWDPAGTQTVARCDLTPHAEAPRHAPAQAAGLPLPWWHYFSARDLEGSRALRSVTDEAIAQVMIAAREDLAATDDAEACTWDKAVAAVAVAIPDVSNERLRAGLAGLAGLGAQDEARLQAKLAEVGGTGESATSAMDAFATGGTERQRFPFLELDLEELVNLGSLAFRTAVDQTDSSESRLAKLKVAAGSTLGLLEVPVRHLEGAYKQPPSKPESYQTHWWGLVENGNRYIVKVTAGWNNEVSYDALELAASGTFSPLAGADVNEEHVGGWRGPAVADFVREFESRGPVPLDTAIGPVLAQATGLSEGAALLLWLGAPGVDNWEKNFLPKTLREALGWKVAQAQQARVEIKGAADKAKRRRIYERAMPKNPADLWDPIASGAVAQFAAAFEEVVGKRVSVDSAVVADAARRLDGWRRKSATALPEVVAPEGTALSRDGTWAVVLDDGSFEVTASSKGTEDCFEGSAIGNAAQYVPFLFGLPVGHSMRNAIPGYLELVRARLRHKDFLVQVSSDYLYGEPEKLKKEVAKHLSAYHGGRYDLRSSFGGEIVKSAGVHAIDTGSLIVAACYDPTGQSSYGYVCVAARLHALLDNSQELARFADQEIVTSARLVESDGFTALAARVVETPVPEGQYEQNPVHSAPELVAEVAAALSVGEESACAYLQMLALMEPTTKNLRLWNGWTAARLKKALAPLVEAGLLLEAKRARAGRGQFLPGGWVTRSAPLLPYESWKAPMYGISDGNGPLDAYLPLQPFHELFGLAWRRVLDGDKPDYEEV